MAKRGRRETDDHRALAAMALLIVTGQSATIREAARATVSEREQGSYGDSVADRLRKKYSKHRVRLESDAREQIAERAKSSASKPTPEQAKRMERAARGALRAMKRAMGISEVSPEELLKREAEKLKLTIEGTLEALGIRKSPEDE